MTNARPANGSVTIAPIANLQNAVPNGGKTSFKCLPITWLEANISDSIISIIYDLVFCLFTGVFITYYREGHFILVSGLISRFL